MINFILDITQDEMLKNINSNLNEIKQSSEFSKSKIIKANVTLVQNIISNEKDKYAILQKLKDHNLHSIALRNVGVKIVRIFSAQGSECVEIISQPSQGCYIEVDILKFFNLKKSK